MIGYVVFFFLLGIAWFVCLKHEWRELKKMPAGQNVIVDTQRFLLESPIERRLYDTLVFRGEYVKSQVPCGKYRIDLVLPAYKIAIECDGKAYHSSPTQKAHDRRKNAYLRNNGYKVLRFSGSSITSRMSKVLERIEKEKIK